MLASWRKIFDALAVFECGGLHGQSHLEIKVIEQSDLWTPMSSFRKLVNGNCWPLFATSLCVSLCVHLISGQGIKDVFYKGSKPHDPFIENLQNSGTFECRSRGQLIRLNQRHFNDDYCDCEDDGKDEPGTSACSYILEPLGNYHCADDRYMMQEVWSLSHYIQALLGINWLFFAGS